MATKDQKELLQLLIASAPALTEAAKRVYERFSARPPGPATSMGTDKEIAVLREQLVQQAQLIAGLAQQIEQGTRVLEALRTKLRISTLLAVAAVLLAIAAILLFLVG